jgi:hypothetical protein
MSPAKRLTAITLFALSLPSSPAPVHAGTPGEVESVPRATIAAAMRAEQGYERRATTNQSRLQTRVFLRLAREAARPDATLFIDHEDWFQAYLETLGLSADQAPLSVRLSHEHQYDISLDMRPGVVVESVRRGRPPSQALNVRWRSRRGTPRYSYRDLLSHPVIEVTFQKTVSYRLLEMDGMVVVDQMSGASGRPVNGPLSLLFRLIGSARAVWSRYALAEDGWRVVVGHGRKGPVTRTVTVTIRPDGRIDPGVPADRADLAALEQRLKAPLDVVYRPWRRD